MAKKRLSTEDLNKDLNQKQSKKVSDEYLSKIEPTYNEINELLKANEDNEYISPLELNKKIKIIEEELKKAIVNDDFNKALAILNYAHLVADTPLNTLNLGNFEDKDSIAHIALERDTVEEFTNLLLIGESRGYLGTE